jgi:hypothetical protein
MLTFLLVAVFTIVAVRVLVISSEMHDERREAYRAGTHDYYGNKLD